jgi:hypothetical protein
LTSEVFDLVLLTFSVTPDPLVGVVSALAGGFIAAAHAILEAFLSLYRVIAGG